MAKTAEIVDLSKGKTKLIRVAMAMFAERGFDGVTVRDISAQAGVSVGLINHHFGSKEGLREAVDVYFISQFEEVVTEQRPRPEETKSRGLDAIVDWTEDWSGRHIGDWDV